MPKMFENYVTVILNNANNRRRRGIVPVKHQFITIQRSIRLSPTGTDIEYRVIG